jgi:hypothetical protein
METLVGIATGAIIVLVTVTPVILALFRGERTAQGLAKAWAEGIEGTKVLLPEHYRVVTGLARAATERHGVQDAAVALLKSLGLNQASGQATGLTTDANAGTPKP